MRGIHQHVVRLVDFAVLHLLNLVPDGQHHVDKVVEFGKAFALRRFNHQCAVYREGEGRGMISIIHQALGDVVFADARLFVHLTAFQYHFVSYEAGSTAVNDAVCILEAGCQVVGAEDGYLCGPCQPFCSHHADISVSNGEDTCTAEGGSGHLVGCIAEQFMSRKERNQMLCHTDGTYARSAAAVRRGERFVQIQMADIRTDKAGIRQAYLGIHIGTVHIYLRTAGVYNVADFHNFRFKDTVCGRVGNH